MLDYLLKPFSFDRFMQAVGKAMQRLMVQPKEPQPVAPVAAAPAEPVADLPQDPNANIMLVKADHKIHRVRYDSIVYIEGLREYVTIFCEGEKIITLESLRNLEDTLPPNMFIRVHKSYIVRIDKIRALYGSQIKLDGVQQYIPVGKSYKDDVQKRFFEK